MNLGFLDGLSYKFLTHPFLASFGGGSKEISTTPKIGILVVIFLGESVGFPSGVKYKAIASCPWPIPLIPLTRNSYSEIENTFLLESRSYHLHFKY